MDSLNDLLHVAPLISPLVAATCGILSAGVAYSVARYTSRRTTERLLFEAKRKDIRDGLDLYLKLLDKIGNLVGTRILEPLQNPGAWQWDVAWIEQRIEEVNGLQAEHSGMSYSVAHQLFRAATFDLTDALALPVSKLAQLQIYLQALARLSDWAENDERQSHVDSVVKTARDVVGAAFKAKADIQKAMGL